MSHLLSLSLPHHCAFAPEQFQSLLYYQYSAVVFNDLVLSGHHCLRHGTRCQEEQSPAARILLPSFHLSQESHTVPIRQLCSPLLHALPLSELVSLSLCLEEPSRALHAEISIKISLTTPAFIPRPLYRPWVCILLFSHLTLTMGASFLNSREKLRAYWRTNVGLEGRPHSLWEHRHYDEFGQ